MNMEKTDLQRRKAQKRGLNEIDAACGAICEDATP